jgi:hypothetical protein
MRAIFSLRIIGLFSLPLFVATAPLAKADQIEMLNGDRYQGKIISLNSNEVVLNSDMLGLVKVPRAKVSGITAGTAIASTPTAPPTPAQSQTTAAIAIPRTSAGVIVARTNSAPAVDFSELQTNSALAKQVQSKYLAEAGPEATAKYNQMLKDLFSGKMSISDLRNQAKSAADQLRGYKKELGSEAGSELDEYLTILDKFVNEAAGEDVKAAAPALPLKKSAVPNQ